MVKSVEARTIRASTMTCFTAISSKSIILRTLSIFSAVSLIINVLVRTSATALPRELNKLSSASESELAVRFDVAPLPSRDSSNNFKISAALV